MFIRKDITPIRSPDKYAVCEENSTSKQFYIGNAHFKVTKHPTTKDPRDGVFELGKIDPGPKLVQVHSTQIHKGKIMEKLKRMVSTFCRQGANPDVVPTGLSPKGRR